MPLINYEESLYKQWYASSLNLPDLIPWIDGMITKEWGLHAAARVWHILTDGSDGEVEQVRNLKAHQLSLSSTTPVPGAVAPVQNLYHVSQALSWIAGTRNTIPERLEYVKAIPRLIEPLTKAA